MIFNTTEIEGLFLLEPFSHQDVRGSFIKPYDFEKFKAHNLDFNIRESFYSTSKKGVIRGMHFQFGSFAHKKIVFCTQGSVEDVVLDIRKNSSTFGKFLSFRLTAENKHQLFIPIGLAHGFKSLENDSTLVYLTSKENHKEFDGGIHYNSFGYDWLEDEASTLSDRDLKHPLFKDFVSPF